MLQHLRERAAANWVTQGADAGKYANADIWAVRLLAMEPTRTAATAPTRAGSSRTTPASGCASWARSRSASSRPTAAPILDPEGNPDTSFLAKIPADTPFTFQTLDRNGLVLNMAQTWHQVRPGEVRADCGGCHAHSQQPLDFERTAAARPDYQVWDLFIKRRS